MSVNDHPVLRHAPLPIGARVTVPNQINIRKTGNPGPLRKGIPIIREWKHAFHGWPPETEFTITGVAILRDTTLSIDECGDWIEEITRTQIVYLARQHPQSREIRLHPKHIRSI